jgi:hypothetical protein
MMMTTRTIGLSVSASMLTLLVGLAGCDKKAQAPASDGHTHSEGDGHDHGTSVPGKTADSHDDGHGHGETVQLGEQTVDGMTVKASRDGAITAGKDAAIDVWVTGGTGKVAAVRFWIGTQDAKGSMKAKAELEKDNWHTHAEVPAPLPAGSKLWVEVELESGSKSVAGFELKS